MSGNPWLLGVIFREERLEGEKLYFESFSSLILCVLAYIFVRFNCVGGFRALIIILWMLKVVNMPFG